MIGSGATAWDEVGAGKLRGTHTQAAPTSAKARLPTSCAGSVCKRLRLNTKLHGAAVHWVVVDLCYLRQVRRGLENFRQEVEDGVFPQAQHSPYKMSAGEEQAFQRLLEKVRGISRSSEGTLHVTDKPPSPSGRVHGICICAGVPRYAIQAVLVPPLAIDGS